MITPYSLQEIPEVHSPEEAPSLLDRMVKSNLPMFVARSAGATVEEATETYRVPIEKAGFVPSVKHPVPLSYEKASLWLKVRRRSTWQHKTSPNGARYSDISLHMDSHPHPRGYTVSSLGLNYMEEGAAEASFFEPTEAFAREEIRDINIGPNGRMHYLFVEGLIDDEILKPNGYRTELRENDLIIFRIGGKLPLAHHFKTTKYPRTAVVITAGSVREN